MKPLFVQTFEKAIRKIIQEIVKRVGIASIMPLKYIILKDFSLEGDERKMMKSAKAMIIGLVGNLSLAVAKEPLKASLQLCLAESVKDLRLEESVKIQIMKNAMNHYLFLLNNLASKIVIEKAAHDFFRDSDIAEAIERRRVAREQGGRYIDEGAAIYQLTMGVPEVLRSTPSGLSPEQLKIFEDFEKKPTA